MLAFYRPLQGFETMVVLTRADLRRQRSPDALKAYICEQLSVPVEQAAVTWWSTTSPPPVYGPRGVFGTGADLEHTVDIANSWCVEEQGNNDASAHAMDTTA